MLEMVDAFEVPSSSKDPVMSNRKHTLPSDTKVVHEIQAEIEQSLKKHKFSEHDVFGVRLALEEALVNAIKHGNQLDAGKMITVAYQITNERFDIYIEDEGAGFNLEDVPDPMAPENLERDCGRGLLLMRHYMTEVTYNGKGNAVSMHKIRTPEENGKE